MQYALPKAYAFRLQLLWVINQRGYNFVAYQLSGNAKEFTIG